MKVIRSLVIRAALLSLLLACSPLASTAQTNSVRARVTQAVDLQNLTTLRGNVHPLARQEFDQGVAPDDLPMERILLVLQRGSNQPGRAGKLNGRSACPDFCYLEALRSQPLGDCLNIRISGAKLPAKLFRGEPLVKLPGGLHLLLIQQLAQGSFLV